MSAIPKLVQIPQTKLVRDTENMALVNRDAQGLEAYKKRRAILIAQSEEINTLKRELGELKVLLNKLIEDKTNG